MKTFYLIEERQKQQIESTGVTEATNIIALIKLYHY